MTAPIPVRLVLVATTLCLGVLACAPRPGLREDPDAYREEVARLQREIAEHPGDAEALRDLGAIYVRTKRAADGEPYLQKAYSQDRDDPKTLFYLGVASERTGKRQKALRLYERYAEVPEDSPYRSLIQGRYEWLLRQRIRREVAEKLKREEQLAGTEVSPSTVAVLPFAYQGGNERFAPLSRGLSEMISTDLATVGRLTVVERVRLQALLDELKLSQSNFVDPSTAPRTGLLLGAGRLVGGGFAVRNGETVDVDVTLAQLRRDTASAEVESQSGALDRLFDLEREIVFGVLRRFGIEREDLTAEELAEIERAPTRDLQAFLAFSRGLLEEDAGNFGAAAEAYRRGRELDPSFQEAAAREAEVERLHTAGGPTENALQAAAQIEPPPSPINLVDRQLRSLMGRVGAGFQRDPAAEEQIDGNLSEPPDPPPR